MYIEPLFHDDFQPKALGSAVWRTLEREVPKSILGSLIIFFFMKAVLGYNADICFLSQAVGFFTPCKHGLWYVRLAVERGVLGCSSVTGYSSGCWLQALFSRNSHEIERLWQRYTHPNQFIGSSIFTNPEREFTGKSTIKGDTSVLYYSNHHGIPYWSQKIQEVYRTISWSSL